MKLIWHSINCKYWTFEYIYPNRLGYNNLYLTFLYYPMYRYMIQVTLKISSIFSKLPQCLLIFTIYASVMLSSYYDQSLRMKTDTDQTYRVILILIYKAMCPFYYYKPVLTITETIRTTV